MVRGRLDRLDLHRDEALTGGAFGAPVKVSDGDGVFFGYNRARRWSPASRWMRWEMR
jgi:2-hydroxychromene-2-carboxylate isomerase